MSFTGGLTDTDIGVKVNNNSGGAVSFAGGVTINTGANDAVTLTGNTATALSFNCSSLAITTTTGQGFVASNGGTVTETVAVTGSSNTIASSAGVGLSLGSMTVGSDGMNFKSITSAGAAHGINLVDVSGGSITVAGGSISNTTDSAFNVVGGSVNVNYTGLITQNNNAAAVSVTGGHSGALTFMSIASGSDVIATTNGTGLQFNNANGSYNFDQISVGGANSAAIGIVNSNGSFYFSAGTITGNTGAAAVTVNGGSPIYVVIGTTINNTVGNSVLLENMTGGTTSYVGVTGNVTDSGSGIVVQNNDIGVFFTGSLTLNTTSHDAITLTNNTGSLILFQGGSAITTTSGRGVVASGGGTLTMNGGTSTNTIATDTGAALDISNITVTSSTASSNNNIVFNSVSTGSAVNGILLSNITGGTVAVNGGTLSGTTGNAVSATNVANLSLNNMTITGAGNDGVYIAHNDANASVVTVNGGTISNSAGNGIEFSASGPTTLNLTGNSITDSANVNAVSLSVAGSTANTVFMTVTGNTATTADGSALVLNLTSTAGTVTTLFSGNTFNNNSAASAAASFQNTGTLTFNGTFQTNTFSNGGTGDNFNATTNAAGAVTALYLTGNTATGGAAAYDLVNTSGTLSVCPSKSSMEGANTGTFNYTNVTESSTIPPKPPTP